MVPDACPHWALAQQPAAVVKLHVATRHVWIEGSLLERVRSLPVMVVVCWPVM